MLTLKEINYLAEEISNPEYSESEIEFNNPCDEDYEYSDLWTEYYPSLFDEGLDDPPF